jgi:hypothetical protein
MRQRPSKHIVSVVDDGSDFDPEDIGGPDYGADGISIFDPKKIDVAITTPNMGVLIDRLRHNEIELIPDFQRSGDLWDKRTQSRLIESLLIRLPIPAFYFDAAVDDRWQIVDGLQRLSAINNFVINKNLPLTNLEFLKDHEGDYYDDLPRSLQRRIDEFQTSVYLIKPGTPLIMKYSLFHRINTGGLKLTHQEIRHAMSQSVNRGRASKFLTDLVDDEAFKKVVGATNRRMAYQELVLRHLAFVVYDMTEYKSNLPRFLDQAMVYIGEITEEKLSRFKRKFLLAMKLAFDLFGEHAFKKTLAVPGHKRVVNKPLFEAVSVNLAELTQVQRELILKNKNRFLNDFKHLLEDESFDESISKSTANTDYVQTRFRETKIVIWKHCKR